MLWLLRLEGPLNHPEVKIYLWRCSCERVFNKNIATRIFRNCAVISELHAGDDPKVALARFALSFATLCSSAHLSSWLSVPPHWARRRERRVRVPASRQTYCFCCWRDQTRVVTSWPTLKITESSTEEKGLLIGISGAPAARSTAAFSIVHCDGILNSMHAFTWNVKDLSKMV